MGKKTLGVLITHIKDFLHCRKALFDEKILQPLTNGFTAGIHESTSFQYIGFDLKQTKKDITLSQDTYVYNLQSIRIEASRAKDKKSLLTQE